MAFFHTPNERKDIKVRGTITASRSDRIGSSTKATQKPMHMHYLTSEAVLKSAVPKIELILRENLGRVCGCLAAGGASPAEGWYSVAQ